LAWLLKTLLLLGRAEARPGGRARTRASAPRRRADERGVTLMEMLVVMVLIALLAALTFPSLTSGMDSIRLRSAASSVISTFNLALTRADRLQEAVDVTVSPARHLIEARTVATGIVRRAELPKEVRIAHVYPEEGLASVSEEGLPPDRHFIVYPNGAVPRITLDLMNEHGTHRYVLLDPITGVARERVNTDPSAEYVAEDRPVAAVKDAP
jgi:prepilin-type N-terminal cleavage/methylation domain-containing protein